MNTQEKLRKFMNEKIDKQKQAGAEFLAENAKKEGVISLEGNLQYKILKEGTGTQAKIGDTIKAHYKGALLSGQIFDSSFARNQPFSAPIRNLIHGWQIIVPMMKEGSHWQIWIPSDLAYGDRGAGSDIPGGATLDFEIELLEIL